jgi:hypothetical protein
MEQVPVLLDEVRVGDCDPALTGPRPVPQAGGVDLRPGAHGTPDRPADTVDGELDELERLGGSSVERADGLDVVHHRAGRIVQRVPVLVEVGDTGEPHYPVDGNDKVLGPIRGDEHRALALSRSSHPRREGHRHLHVEAALAAADQLLAKVGVQVIRQGPVPELDLQTVLHDAVARLRRHEGCEAVRPRGEVIGDDVADAPDPVRSRRRGCGAGGWSGWRSRSRRA